MEVIEIWPPRHDEEAAFERVERELTQRFPDLPEVTVTAAVREERRRLDDSPVRDFLPLLVQRAAAKRLRSDPARVPAVAWGTASD